MDTKSKILFIILGLLILGSVGFTYWKIMVQKDYVIEMQADCDPYVEKCFIWECDPESDVEGEKCTGDPEEDIWYFQVVRRNAFNIPLCDPNTDETCDPYTCSEGEAGCESEFCTEDNMEKQYASACNDPVKYTEENPEEEEECEEGDEECLSEESECTEDDEECLAAEEEAVECEEGDTECEAAAEEEDSSADEAECAPDDEECLVEEEAAEEDDTEPSAAKTVTPSQPQIPAGNVKK